MAIEKFKKKEKIDWYEFTPNIRWKSETLSFHLIILMTFTILHGYLLQYSYNLLCLGVTLDLWPCPYKDHFEKLCLTSAPGTCGHFLFFYFFIFFNFFFLTWSSRGSWSASGTCIGWFYALLMLPTLEVEWTVSEWVCEDESSSRLCWTSCLDPEARTWLKYLLLELGFISK